MIVNRESNFCQTGYSKICRVIPKNSSTRVSVRYRLFVRYFVVSSSNVTNFLPRPALKPNCFFFFASSSSEIQLICLPRLLTTSRHGAFATVRRSMRFRGSRSKIHRLRVSPPTSRTKKNVTFSRGRRKTLTPGGRARAVGFRKASGGGSCV